MVTADNFPRCAAVVDLGAIRRNVGRVRRLLTPGCGLLAVVKADAYGHGVLAVSRAAGAAGATHLGVATAQEGAFLRQNGVDAPILVFGVCLMDDVALAVENGLIQTICDREAAAAVGAEARRLGVAAEAHFKVDTGMARLGPSCGEAAAQIEAAMLVEGLRVTGIYSHLADSDDAACAYTDEQAALFEGVLAALKARGVDLPAHISNSGSILRRRVCDYAMVRAGIAVYGLSCAGGAGFEAALALKARVAYVKQIPAGATVGYGRTYTAKRPTDVATVAIGYADGYSRLLSNRAEVLLNGRRAKVIGNVCMDQLMVDATDCGAAAGDAATLIGRDGAETVTAEELAAAVGTIPYEIVTGISPRVPRVYL